MSKRPTFADLIKAKQDTEEQQKKPAPLPVSDPKDPSDQVGIEAPAVINAKLAIAGQPATSRHDSDSQLAVPVAVQQAAQPASRQADNVASQPATLLASRQAIVAASQADTLLASQPAANLAGQGKLREGKTLFSVRLPDAQAEEIRIFCDKYKLQIQDFFSLAAGQLMAYVASQDLISRPAGETASHTAGSVASRQAHDDLKIFKTHEDIIMLYRQYVGRKWTAADDRVGVGLNNIDRRLIEIGMIHTIVNARGRRINSFAYFVPEIQVMIDLHMDNTQLDGYLRARRERLAKIKGEQ